MYVELNTWLCHISGAKRQETRPYKSCITHCELLEMARKEVVEQGYQFKKGKSRSKRLMKYTYFYIQDYEWLFLENLGRLNGLFLGDVL